MNVLYSKTYAVLVLGVLPARQHSVDTMIDLTVEIRLENGKLLLDSNPILAKEKYTVSISSIHTKTPCLVDASMKIYQCTAKAFSNLE